MTIIVTSPGVQTTALDIIKRSMRLLGVYSIGEQPSADECADSLRALNAMLDSMANENLFVFAKSLDVVPLTANDGSYSVGPTGDVATVRPIEVSTASYIEYMGVSYPLMIATLNDYNQIPVKSLIAGIPNEMYVLNSMPNVTVNLWPVPSTAMTLYLWSNKLLQSFTSLTDVLTLPPGYERMLGYCLAEEMADEFEAVASANVVKKAAQARKVMKRTNTEVPRLSMPYGVPMGRGFVNYRNA